MKKREGFVSNSSSASFVVYWRCLEQEEGDSVERVVDGLFEFSKEIKEYLKDNTQETSSAGTYKTTGWTSMYNDVGVIPQEVAYLVLGLKIGKGYELIDVNVEYDH